MQRGSFARKTSVFLILYSSYDSSYDSNYDSSYDSNYDSNYEVNNHFLNMYYMIKKSSVSESNQLPGETYCLDVISTIPRSTK